MKDYNEMAESVFERRDKYNAERRMAMNKFKKGMTGAVCCCLVALLGVGVLNDDQVIPNDTPNIGVQDLHENKVEAGKKDFGSEQVVDPVQNVEDVPADSNGEYSEEIKSSASAKGTSEFLAVLIQTIMETL